MTRNTTRRPHSGCDVFTEWVYHMNHYQARQSTRARCPLDINPSKTDLCWFAEVGFNTAHPAPLET